MTYEECWIAHKIDDHLERWKYGPPYGDNRTYGEVKSVIIEMMANQYHEGRIDQMKEEMEIRDDEDLI